VEFAFQWRVVPTDGGSAINLGGAQADRSEVRVPALLLEVSLQLATVAKENAF